MGMHTSPQHPRQRITTLLIVNRGEIARRIQRTCKELSIRTVVVFAPVDASAPYVRDANTAIALPSPADFRNASLLLQIAREEGADAVHPGYGFLSENADFVELLEGENLLFVGPSSHSMRLLGNKANAKELAITANVPIPPTKSLLAAPEGERVSAIAEFGSQVGYPLMLKAASGGGGRGMRVVSHADEIAMHLATVERESARAFGSSEIFVEKYLSPARHVEVQLLGDRMGNVVALGTRDCTIQRSNQKIIEEAPAPSLPDQTLQAICEAAVRLGKAAGYYCAGTVEFLVTPSNEFFLLEMNCRLQVEHPVTELITGRDLVSDQLRITEGYTLSEIALLAPVKVSGHAIEARLCAEAFDDTVVLSTGKLGRITLPRTIPGHEVRCDFGYEQGDVVSPDFDSLLGKVIAYGATRGDAIRNLVAAIENTRITGVRTNRDVISEILTQEAFQKVDHSVAGSKGLFPSSQKRVSQCIEAASIGAALRLLLANAEASAPLPLSGWSLGVPLLYPWSLVVNGTSLLARAAFIDGKAHITVQSEGITSDHTIEIHAPVPHGSHLLEAHISVSERRMTAVFEQYPPSIDRFYGTFWLHLPSGTYELKTKVPRGQGRNRSKDSLGGEIYCPLPGRVTSVAVVVNSDIKEGETLVTLESMKMEHPIRAPFDGRVVELKTTPDASVAAGELLVVLTPKK